MSDHLPIVMHMSFPVTSTIYSDVRQFIPKPKWSALTEDALKSYHHTINQSLNHAGMGSNHPFKSFQQIDLKSQMTYKSLDHDFRLGITLNVFDP